VGQAKPVTTKAGFYYISTGSSSYGVFTTTGVNGNGEAVKESEEFNNDISMSRFMAVIMNTFPSFTKEELLWNTSFSEFFMWHDRAQEMRTGKIIRSKKVNTDDPEEIKSRFVYNEEKGHFE
jgi:hypothetical protein